MRRRRVHGTKLDNRMGGRRKNIEVTFWQRVNKTGPLMPHMDTPCWNWLGCVDRQTGYGRVGILVNNQTIRHAHRYSFQLTRKLIPVVVF